MSQTNNSILFCYPMLILSAWCSPFSASMAWA